MHRRRVASLALSATLFALALGCTPVALPKFDDGKNSGVGGFNGSTGTGGTGSNSGTTSNPTPTPAPTAAPLNYGTLTWKRATQKLPVKADFLAGTVVNGNFVVVGGIPGAGGNLLNTVSAYPVAGDTMSDLQAGVTYRSNIQGGDGVCSHGVFTFGNHLLVVGGQTQLLGFNATTVTALRNDLFTGIWADSLAFPTSDPIGGGRQDFGAAQTDTYAYVVGGNKGTQGVRGNPSADILVATHTNGALGDWRNVESLPFGTIAPAAVVANNRLYVFGGQEDTPGTPTITNKVASYAINSDGTLGTRRNETSELDTTGSLPGRSSATMFAFSNHLYIVGGMGSTGPSTECYIAVLGDNGTVSKWKAAGSLPDKVAALAAGTDTAGHFYLGGGRVEYDTSPQGGEANDLIYIGTASLQ